MEGGWKVSRKGAAIAVAGSLMGGVAHAQSNITLYGIVDAGLLYTSKTAGANGQNLGHQFSAVDSGSLPSQFGLTGTEDLGGGMKASFKLESGINMRNGGFDDSNGNLFGRQAYVALENQFGKVAIGLQFSPFFLSLLDTDPRGFSQLGSGLIIYADTVTGTGAFNSNAVSYTSPTIAGLQGKAMLALGGAAGNFQAGRQYSASLKYTVGNLLISGGIYSGNSGGTVSTPIPTTVAFWGRAIGATYNFGVVTAKAQFVNYKVAQSYDSNVYSAGLDSYVTPQLNLNGGIYFTSDRNHTANHSIMGAAGATYNLSKSTALYAQVAVVNNHGTMNTGISADGALYGAQGTTVGADIGIRHFF
ncbi:porin [Burkholderia lata]|uniref:Outer membrane protein (Porin) n=1 Tax=Burkholderia lata (strain ATCC 17760 / DSM 23089 / LMG 22485 / NCIMB 9086 / R18194 / 383) TaxID=482957 RepID=Q397Q7_BURL3|nr:porin [Burkholderia lata]ABB11304.1 outer membrane protein (porin) [Burkholderia lata]